MRLREFVFLFIKSLNPLEYNILVTRKKRDSLKYFFYLIIISILFSSISYLPKLSHLPENIDTTLSKFEVFNITGIDVKMSEPIILGSNPRILLDLRENITTLEEDADITITKTEIMWRKIHPDILKFRVYETEKKPIGEYGNVIGNIDRIKGLYWILLFLALPSIFLTAFLWNTLKYLFISFVSSLLASIFFIRQMHFAKIWRTSVFALTILISLEIVVYPLINLGLLAMLLYYLIFFMALIFESNKKLRFSKDDKKAKED